MAKMSEHELLAILNISVNDAVLYNTDFMADNERLLKQYFAEPYGDELDDRSQVVSTDIADVVEADMPSLMRVFMGSGDIVKFVPRSDNPQDINEAEEKTSYVDWIIRNQPESFNIIHSWVKDAEIQKMGVVKYFIEDTRQSEEHKYTGLDQMEIAEIVDSLQGEDVEKVEVTEHQENDDATFDLTFKVTTGKQCVRIINVPTESFLITRNASCRDDAALIGDRMVKARGDLIAEGFDRDLVMMLPSIDDDLERESTLHQIRFNDQVQVGDEEMAHWANEEVEIYDLYAKVDYDGDGIPERRHIMYSGNHILENEPFNHIPYAMFSSIMMPHKAIGRSRAEITQQTQRVKTVLLRQTLDNIYMVNNGRNVVNDLVDLDDMLTVRQGGIVRSEGEGPVQNNVMPLVTPYVGDKALQVIQYMDQARAQTTGSLLASQGLEADSLGKETATRFKGVEEASEAKIELVARVMAETGFRQLYEGICWLVSKFQDDATEIRAMGKTITVDPSGWKYNHHVETEVGLGAADNEQTIQTLNYLLSTHLQLQQMGSPLTDQKKIFNILDKIVKATDLRQTQLYFNDPEQPQELVMAENEILKRNLQMLQQQVQSNPLAEVEQVRAQAKLIEAQSKAQIDVARMQEDQRQFDAKLMADMEKSNKELALKLTELETKVNQQLNAEYKSNQQ